MSSVGVADYEAGQFYGVIAMRFFKNSYERSEFFLGHAISMGRSDHRERRVGTYNLSTANR